MNLLSKTGIQGDSSCMISHTNQNQIVKNKKNNNSTSQKNKRVNKKHRSIVSYFNLIQLIAFALFLFFSYSFYVSSNNSNIKKIEMDFSKLFSELSNSRINSVEFIDNELEIILDYNQSHSIYKDYDLYYDDYSYVRLLINNKKSQIHIRNQYNLNYNVDFYELLSIISYLDDISIEKDIINNNLVIVGDSFDIINIFKSTNNFYYNFKLNLIKKNKDKNFYQLTIFND